MEGFEKKFHHLFIVDFFLGISFIRPPDINSKILDDVPSWICQNFLMLFIVEFLLESFAGIPSKICC